MAEQLEQAEQLKKEKEEKQRKLEAEAKVQAPEAQKSGRGLGIVGIIFAVLLSITVFASMAGIGFIYSIIKDAPPIDTRNIGALLSENSVVYDSEGNVLDNIFLGSKSTNVYYSDLPENLKNAFIAVEDKTFWEHSGFNIVRIIGAFMEGMQTGEKISGTSTITQQLARNLFLAESRSEYSLNRKLIEAYYAVLIEKDLTKEQILEAYLNRIFLGFGARGVQAASREYFSKNVGELTLSECAALAAIIQEPNALSLIKTLPNASVPEDSEDVIYRGLVYTYLYNEKASEKRRHMILGLMNEQGLITESEYRRAISDDIRDHINPPIGLEEERISYFTDYAVKEVVADLAAEFEIREDEAWNMLFNGGLHIYTTVDVPMQNILEREFLDNGNFPRTANYRRDRAGNILKPAGGILLYDYNNYFDEEGNFIIKPDEYEWRGSGDLVLFSGKRLNFFRTESSGRVDYTANFKSMYLREDGVFYTINEGVLSIPAEYKGRNADGHLIIDREFLKAHPSFFTESEEGLTVAAGSYILNQKVVQPQSAMVILNYNTGEIKAMVGGRSTVGRLLYNRAEKPRQPGSAIKPISVYGPALASAAGTLAGEIEYYPWQYVDFEPEMEIEGRYWTAASVIHDSEITRDEKPWPKNWYEGYRGPMTVRVSLEQSINVNAVKAFSQIGPDFSVEFLKKLGIKTVVTEGPVNDMNAAALALGGMTEGISPLEMAGAYGTFANGGCYNKPVAYTKVTNRYGDIILENKPQNIQVIDPGVAFIMTDILRTTVTSGLGRRASVQGWTVAGKTGTTSDNYDAWFVGLTPGYAASLWIGNDVNIELSEGSMAAARLWSKIMAQVLEGKEAGSFPPMPENVVRASGEYFIKGTQGGSITEILILPEPEEDEEEDESSGGGETPENSINEEIAGGGERPSEQGVD